MTEQNRAPQPPAPAPAPPAPAAVPPAPRAVPVPEFRLTHAEQHPLDIKSEAPPE